MISLEQAKKLINDPSLSNAEVAEMQNALHRLAEIILEAQRDQKLEANLIENE